MKTVTIYRVEDRDGEGPYRLSHHLWADEGNYHDDERYPTMQEDRGLVPRLKEIREIGVKSFYFGFSSMDQLRQWFSKDELVRLYQRGYRITSYVVHEIHQIPGERQTIFLKRYSLPGSRPEWAHEKWLEAA